jgi:hypothetical protein
LPTTITLFTDAISHPRQSIDVLTTPPAKPR